jgi:hypothetical protein
MIRANSYNIKLNVTLHQDVHSKLCAENLASASDQLQPNHSVNSVLFMGTAWGDSSGRAAPKAALDDGAWDVILFQKRFGVFFKESSLFLFLFLARH